MMRAYVLPWGDVLEIDGAVLYRPARWKQGRKPLPVSRGYAAKTLRRYRRTVRRAG